MTDVLTIGDVARTYEVPVWRVRRLYTRGLLPEPDRIGGVRVVPRDDLPVVEAALREAGYLVHAGGCGR